MKLSIPGPKSAAQQTQKVDTKAITTPLMLPVHVLVNAMPRELVSCDVGTLAASPDGQREVAVPMSTVLAMLPSGRIEFPAREVIGWLPPGLTVTAAEAPENYPVSLPLATVVPRIPPEMLAIRPDQKDVDPAVRNMNDPFTKEMIDKLAAQNSQAVEAAPTPPAPPTPEPIPAPVEEPSLADQFAGMGGTDPAPAEAQAPMEMEPELQAETPEPAMDFPTFPEPAAAEAEPDFASLRELALQASQETETTAEAESEPEPEALPAEEKGFAPEVEAEPEAVAPAQKFELPSDFGVKTIDDPLTAKITVPPPSVPQPPEVQDLESFAFPDPEQSPAEEVAATPEPEPESGAVLEPSAEFTPGDFSLPEPEPEPVAITKPEPEPEPEPVPEPEPIAELEPKPEPEPEPEVVAEPEPEPEPEEPGAVVEPEPQPEPEPVQATEPEPAPLPKPEFKLPVLPPKPPVIPRPSPVEPSERFTPPEPPKVQPAIGPVVRAPVAKSTPASRKPEVSKVEQPAVETDSKEIRINLNRAGVEDLTKIPGVSPRLARKILAWRELHGDFKEFSQLLSIPGMTKDIYRQFTGDPDSETSLSAQINLLLGAKLDEKLSLRDVASHIHRWPSIQGCIIAGAEGLPIAKDVTDGDLAESISAFLPKIMQNINDSMEQIKAMPANEVHIVSEEIGYFIYRRKSLFLVMLSSEKDLPEYYGKVVRALLQELTDGKKTRVEL
jgi:competence ComEA-like helix-hairpin-helix protein